MATGKDSQKQNKDAKLKCRKTDDENTQKNCEQYNKKFWIRMR
jgi:hypothetical protein